MTSPAALVTLLRADLVAQRGRLVAGSIALGVAASLLLAAFIAVEHTGREQKRLAEAVLPANEIHLAATDHLHPRIAASVLAELRADVRIASVASAARALVVPQPATASGEIDRPLYDGWYGGNASGLTGWGGWLPGEWLRVWAWLDGHRPELVAGTWAEVSNASAASAVNPASAASAPSDASDAIAVASTPVFWQGVNGALGRWFRFEGDTGVYRAQVVAHLAGASLDSVWVGSVAPFIPEVVVSETALRRLGGRDLQPAIARVQVRDAALVPAVLADWQQRLATEPGSLRLWDRAGLLAENQQVTESGLREGLLVALALAGTCVVILALAVQGAAVRGRLSQYALLRALGAGRGTVFLAVLATAIPLALGGLLVAVLLAWAVKAGLSLAFLTLSGTPPGVLSILATGAIVLFGCVLGAAWPAWRAASIHPLEQTRTDDPRRVAWRCLAVAGVVAGGLVVLAMMPLPLADQGWLLGWVGLPLVGLSALLVAPMMVRTVAALAAGPIAWLTGSRRVVLADQMAGDGARSLGAVAALGFGVAGFVALLSWGMALLQLFLVDPALPRWLASVSGGGLDRQEVAAVRADPRFAEFEPLVLVDTWLGKPAEARGTPWIASTLPVPTLVAGVESTTSLPVVVRAGDPAGLAAADACLISYAFAQLNGLRPGDLLPVEVPGGTTRQYRIAAVVDVPGWLFAFQHNKTRRVNTNHEALVIVQGEAMRRDFQVPYANFLLGDTRNADGSITRFRRDVTPQAALSPEIGERLALEAAITSRFDALRRVEHRPDGDALVISDRRLVRLSDNDELRNALDTYWGADGVKSMGLIPLTVLGLALLSLTGTLVASLQSRARELGVLRSCGLTRWGLIRLVTGESLLLGLAALGAGTAAGAAGAWLLCRIVTALGYYEWVGLTPEFTMPWAWFWPGVVLTLIVCVLSALWAAWRIGRFSPAVLASGGPRS